MKIITLLLFVCLFPSYSAIYYVDKVAGDDAKNGTSQATAWKTVAKVNGSTFTGGDRVLFKRGQTWRETLTVPSNGTSATAPLIFSMYGKKTRPRPVITGFDVLTGVWSNAGSAPAVLAQDNCNRNDSNTWGTATTGGAWTYGAGVYDTSGTTCTITTAWQYGKAHIGTSTTGNVEAYAEWSDTPNSDRQTGFRIRNNAGDNTHYRIFYMRATDGTYATDTLYVVKVVNGVASTLSSAAVADAGAAFNIRAMVETITGGVQIRVRYWTGAEPDTTWHINVTDSSSPILSGSFSVELGNDGSSNAKIDNILFQTPNSNFPSVWTISRSTDPVDIVVDGSGVTEDVLTKRSSIAAVNSSPGSFYWASGVLYVRLADSKSPNNSGRIMRAAGRTNAINIGSHTFVTIQGIQATGATDKAIVGTGANVTIKNVIASMSSNGAIQLAGDNAFVQNAVIQDIPGATAYALNLSGEDAKETLCTYKRVSHIPRKISNTGYIARSNVMTLEDDQDYAYEVTTGATDTPTLANNTYYRPTILHGFHQGLSQDGTNRERRLELAKNTGATITRETIKLETFFLGDTDSDGVDEYDFSVYNEQVQEYINSGLKVVYTLHSDSPSSLTGTSCWSYVPGGGSATDGDFITWRNRQVRAFKEWMTQFQEQVEYVEIGNEINEYTFWNTVASPCQDSGNGTANSAQQVSWANAIAAEIKAVKPSVKIAFGGLTGLSASQSVLTGREFLQHAVANGLNTDDFDAVGIHPYDCDDVPTVIECGPKEDKGFDSNFTDIRRVYEDLEDMGLSARWEIWATEWGWFQDIWTSGQREQYAADALEMLRDEFPYVTISTYFLDWSSDGQYDQGGAWETSFTPAGLADVLAQQWSARVSWKGTDYSIHKLASSLGVESGYQWTKP